MPCSLVRRRAIAGESETLVIDQTVRAARREPPVGNIPDRSGYVVHRHLSSPL